MENPLAGDSARALAVIDDAKLCFPDNELLETFVQDAIDPSAAARYLLHRGFDDKASLNLQPLLSEWKELVAIFTSDVAPCPAIDKVIAATVRERDGGRCCITGFEGSLLDPLVVSPIQSLHKPIPESLHETFGAFVGPEMQQRMLSQEVSLHCPSSNWLVRRAAAAAMSQGWIKIKLLPGEKYYVAVSYFGCPAQPPILDRMSGLKMRTFTNHAKYDVDLPDKALVRVASQFTTPIRWSLIARDIATRRSQPRPLTASPLQTSASLATSLWHRAGQRATACYLGLWRRFIPATLRIQLYRALSFLGTHCYGPTCSLKVQQLPFGLYLKTAFAEHHQSLVNEQAALQLVRQHTNVPVPRPLDLVSDARMSFLLMTRAPGIRLGACIDTLSDDETDVLAHDLQQCLGELRAMPRNDDAAALSISNALGEPLYDHRVNMGIPSDLDQSDFKGPFANEDEFNNALRVPIALPGLVHSSGHRIVFTHGDLNMRNVLMHNGRLSAIVDWENAGWCPEYWDYTKAYFVTKLKKRWLRIVDDAFNGNFQSELAIERQYWEYCC